jgi:hypothetical protein
MVQAQTCGGTIMKLNAPTTVVFVVALAIAIVAALQALGTLSILPIAAVWLMAAAYAVLAVGCLFKGA